MRIAIAGSSGLIGGQMLDYWGSLGHSIHRLVRSTPTEDTDIPWDPSLGRLLPAQMEGFDAVLCLSGAGIADARWTRARKQTLLQSRVGPVSLLARTLADCVDKPECLICASATGFYGADRGAEVLTEDSAPGSDFVGGLCVEWEKAAEPAIEAGIRVVNVRFGIVLTPKGGALKRMLPPFRLGLGGAIGSGKQFVSWVGLDDAVGILDFALQSDELCGPINATTPNPITNAEFAGALGRALHRPTVARIPGFVLQRVLGEMSGLILGSLRVFPRRLEAAGYQFQQTDIEATLRKQLGR